MFIKLNDKNSTRIDLSKVVIIERDGSVINFLTDSNRVNGVSYLDYDILLKDLERIDSYLLPSTEKKEIDSDEKMFEMTAVRYSPNDTLQFEINGTWIAASVELSEKYETWKRSREVL